MKIKEMLMVLSEIINNYFLNGLNEQSWKNKQNYSAETSGFSLWLWIFLFITVVLGLFICGLTTLVAIKKTKTKINEFQSEQNNIITANDDEKQEENLKSNISLIKTQNKEMIIKEILQKLQNEAAKKDLLEVELIDIKETKIKIINYMNKNNIKTINDLAIIQDTTIKKLISNFPNFNLESLKTKDEKFLYFLNQIENFIKEKK